ncbi:uncharacterized protein LOC143849587 [Tasmannia lanceolata]|uniref:uncharacterized protein LOC143849587 n=1 Tax=Tasmannia lanceolata TaxID=3420 RepID=UPI004062B9B1
MKEEMRQMKDIFMQNGIIGGEHNSPNQLHSSVASRIDQPNAMDSPPITPHIVLPTHVAPLSAPIDSSIPSVLQRPLFVPATTNSPIALPTNLHVPIARHTTLVGANTPRASPRTKARNNQIQHTAPVAAKTPRSSPQTKARNNQIQHTAPVAAKTPRASPQTKDRNNQIHVCIPCKLMNFEGDAVAKGFLKSEDPNQIVGGKKLGEGWCEVTINGGIS